MYHRTEDQIKENFLPENYLKSITRDFFFPSSLCTTVLVTAKLFGGLGEGVDCCVHSVAISSSLTFVF